MGSLTETEAKRVLYDLAMALKKGGPLAQDVWNILTALRGPDNGAQDLKHRTTAELRGALFAAAGVNLADINCDGFLREYPSGLSMDSLDERMEMAQSNDGDDRKAQDHFAGHMRDALESSHALGILDQDGEVRPGSLKAKRKTTRRRKTTRKA